MSLEGLFFDGIFTATSRPEPDDVVSREMETLKINPVLLNQQVFNNVTRRSLYYHNIETLPKYLPDLRADPHIMSNSYIVLIEPHIRADTDVEIYGYKCISLQRSRETSPNQTNSEGHVIYAKIGESFIGSCTNNTGMKQIFT